MAEDSPSWPMDLFMNDRDLPLLELQQGAEIPPPYRDLLVHMREMTPTLEAYYGSSIHIEPLQVLDGQLTFTREALLRLDSCDRVVEYGVLRAHLGLLSPEAVELLRARRVPMGTILARCGVTHSSSPSGFFRFRNPKFAADKFCLVWDGWLYGRRNTLLNESGRPLAEVCEILPPDAQTGGRDESGV